MKVHVPVRVRYKETDAMGIVHHSNYYVWFELARCAFVEKLGYSYRRIEEDGVFFAVIETQCRYKEPARFEDELDIVVWVEEVKGVRCRFGYQVLREDRLLAEGSTLHCALDRSLKPINMGKTHPDMWKRFQECAEQQ